MKLAFLVAAFAGIVAQPVIIIIPDNSDVDFLQEIRNQKLDPFTPALLSIPDQDINFPVEARSLFLIPDQESSAIVARRLPKQFYLKGIPVTRSGTIAAYN